MERSLEAKYAGVIIVRPDKFEFTEPEGYPAIYSSFIDYGDGRASIGDFILIRDKREYEELFERMEKLYREISEGGETAKSISEVIESLDELENDIKLSLTAASVPVEYRRYIRREDLSKLPKGVRVYRGPRGGLFIDVREVPSDWDIEPEKEPKEVETPKPAKGRRSLDEKIKQGAERFVNYLIEVEGLSLENLIDIRRNDKFRSFMDYYYDFEAWVNRKREEGKVGRGEESEKRRSLDEKKKRAISDIVATSGVSEEFAEVLLDVGSLFFFYTASSNNISVVDYLDSLYSGNDRPRRPVSRGEKAIVHELRKRITPEKYRAWIEFGKTVLNRLGLVKNGKVTVYRGLSAFDGVQVLFARLMGKENIMLHGGLQSFTVSKEIADGFNDFGIVKLELDIDSIRNGFWFSNYPRELEITATVPEEGVRIAEYTHSRAREIDVWMNKAIHDFLKYFQKYYKTGDLSYLKQLKEEIYERGGEVRDYGATLVVSRFLEDVYNLLGSHAVLRAITHDVVYVAYKEFASYVAKLAENLLRDLGKLEKELGARMNVEYRMRIKKYADISRKILMEFDVSKYTLQGVREYLKKKYGNDFERKFVEDVFKDVAPIFTRLADEFIRLVGRGETE